MVLNGKERKEKKKKERKGKEKKKNVKTIKIGCHFNDASWLLDGKRHGEKGEKGDQGRSRATSNSLEMAKREKDWDERGRGRARERDVAAGKGARERTSEPHPLFLPLDGSGSGKQPPSNPRHTHDQPRREPPVRLPASRPRPTTHTRANLAEEPLATARRFAVRHRCPSSKDGAEFLLDVTEIIRKNTNS